MSDRIKLAEAMGWRNCEPRGFVNVDGVPTVGPAGEPPPFNEPPYIAMCPDPFTDANDAWAVHEYFTASEHREDYLDALFELVVRPHSQYSRAEDVTPRHWPRAALKAIE